VSVGVSAEVERIAVLLRCTAREVDFLCRFSAAEVRLLRLAVAERLYADHRTTYARIASASRLLPMRVTAPLAQRMLPARVSAGVVASLPPGQAAALAQRMSVHYVADVSTYLSPTLSEPVLTRLPAEMIVQVATVLGERQDYNTMAEIVGALTDEQVLAVVEAIVDPETLVQVALRVTDTQALHRLTLVLPEERLLVMVGWARRRTRMWPELLTLLGRLPAVQRRRLLSAARAG
jgi:hypothetical protein